MTSQALFGHTRWRFVIFAAVVVLSATVTQGVAVAVQRSHPHCAAGYKPVTKVVRRHGKPRAVAGCNKKAAPTKSTAAPAATPSAAASGSTVAPTAGAPVADRGAVSPLPEAPAASESTPGATEVHAEIGEGFKQNPLAPDEVTWRYSASATRTVTPATGGVSQTETLPLPEGFLAFFVDGKLECEIHAGGAIAGSACTVDLQQLGAHEVSTIFSAGPLSDTAVRTDLVGKYQTSTSLEVSVEPVAPEYLDIGPNAYGFEQYAFEVGRLRISAATRPESVPSFDCEGQPVGCLIPEVTLNRNGSGWLPLYAQHRLNSATGQEEWHVAFDAYNPALRESGWFWQFPNEAVGAQFFHAVGEPDPRLYEPSSATVPLNLNGGHYPLYHWFKAGETGGSVAAVEGTPVHVLTLGTYEKVNGTEASLKFSGRFYTATGEGEGCVYQLWIDGKDMGEHRTATTQGFELLNGYRLPAGPHTFELLVERKAGAGPGNCAITSGTFEAYEVMH